MLRVRMICFHLPALPNALWRVQKTFSAVPCSFKFQRTLVRQRRSPGRRVQPVADSRSGRIACKMVPQVAPQR